MTTLMLIAFVYIVIRCIRHSPAPKRPRIQITQYSEPGTPALVVVDPIKAQRERERQQDRARREADRERKEAERQRKEDEARQAAADEVIRLDTFLLQYRNLYSMIEVELNNDTLTDYKRIQLTEKLINLEQKIYRLEQRRDKAYFTAHN
jgi:hypothetical protein